MRYRHIFFQNRHTSMEVDLELYILVRIWASLTIGMREAEAVNFVVDWFAGYDFPTKYDQSSIILHYDCLGGASDLI